MKNFIQPGKVITAIAPAGGVVSGAFVLIGSMFGVAAFSAAEAAEFELNIGGVYTLPKTAAQGWTAGAKLYWDAVNSKVTTTVGTNVLIGVTAVAVAAADTEANVRLNESF